MPQFMLMKRSGRPVDGARREPGSEEVLEARNAPGGAALPILARTTRFEVEVLRHRLDDPFRAGDALREIVACFQQGQGFVGAEFVVLGLPCFEQRPHRRPGLLQRRPRNVMKLRPHAARNAPVGDPPPHGARAHDGHAPYCSLRIGHDVPL